MRIVYFGSGSFGLPTLEAISKHHEIVAVVTQPDRPAGRGSTLTPTPIAAWAVEYLPQAAVIKPENVNAPEVVAAIHALKPDAYVVIAFGQKMGRSLLDNVPAMNLHASLLPRWRGAAPMNAAILAGDATTGNSVITLADRMDAGMVLGQSTREIFRELTAGELHDLLAIDGPPLVLQALDRAARGEFTGQVQDESKVTLAGKLSRATAWVDFTQTAEECRRRIHGLTPWPGITATLQHEGFGPLPLKLLRVQDWHEPAQQSGDVKPAQLIDVEQGLIACGGGTTLRLLEVQPPGKRSMSWADFSRGRTLPKGATLIGGRA